MIVPPMVQKLVGPLNQLEDHLSGFPANFEQNPDFWANTVRDQSTAVLQNLAPIVTAATAGDTEFARDELATFRRSSAQYLRRLREEIDEVSETANSARSKIATTSKDLNDRAEALQGEVDQVKGKLEEVRTQVESAVGAAQQSFEEELESQHESLANRVGELESDAKSRADQAIDRITQLESSIKERATNRPPRSRMPSHGKGRPGHTRPKRISNERGHWSSPRWASRCLSPPASSAATLSTRSSRMEMSRLLAS